MTAVVRRPGGTINLVPHDPEHLLALLEGDREYERRSGLKVAEGIRAFLLAPDVSPAYLERLRSRSGPNPWTHGFAVVQDATRTVIGTAGFKGPPDGDGVVEIAYGTAPAFEGRGVATQAAAALVRFASSVPEVRLIRAHTLPERNASTQVLTKCGFTFVGEVIDPEDGRVWRWERRPER